MIPPPFHRGAASESSDSIIPNSDLVAWTRIDKLIKGWIIGTLSVEILQQVVELETVADVWKSLNDK